MARSGRLIQQVAIVLSVLVIGSTVNADDGMSSKITAAYIYRLSLLIKLPPPEPKILSFCLYGVEEINELEKYLAMFLEKRATSSEIKDVKVLTKESLAECHYIYMGKHSESHVDEVLAAIRMRPTITISELTGFSDRGGMIQLVAKEGRIVPRINMTTVQENSVSIDANMLNIADAHY